VSDGIFNAMRDDIQAWCKEDRFHAQRVLIQAKGHTSNGNESFDGVFFRQPDVKESGAAMTAEGCLLGLQRRVSVAHRLTCRAKECGDGGVRRHRD
jgi:hypothetical protein